VISKLADKVNVREAFEKIKGETYPIVVDHDDFSETFFFEPVFKEGNEQIKVIEDALNRLDELEAKAAPIKVIFENGYYHCVCGKSLEEYASDGSLNKTWWEYCPECGKKLDWRV
jgi:hypothetical protein